MSESRAKKSRFSRFAKDNFQFLHRRASSIGRQERKLALSEFAQRSIFFFVKIDYLPSLLQFQKRKCPSLKSPWWPRPHVWGSNRFFHASLILHFPWIVNCTDIALSQTYHRCQCLKIIGNYWKSGSGFTLGQKPLFLSRNSVEFDVWEMWILWKNETLKLWILWKK